MTLLDAWKQSEVDAASIDYEGMQITVICRQTDTLGVIVGTDDMKPYTPEDFGDLCRILGIDPANGWQPVSSFAVSI